LDTNGHAFAALQALNRGEKLTYFHPKAIVVVEQTEDVFTLIEVKGSPKDAALRRYMIQELPGRGISAEWLREIWQRENIPSRRVIGILPQRWIKYKWLTVPVLPEHQLENMIRLELESLANEEEFPRLIGREIRDSMVALKIALIKKREFEQFYDLYRQAGLEVVWTGYYARGVQNFIDYHQGFFADRNQASAFLILNRGGAEFGVCTETEIIYRRDIPVTAENPSGSGDHPWKTELMEELRLSIASYQSSSGQEKPAPIRLFGNQRKELPGLASFLVKQGFQVEVNEKTRLTGANLGGDTPALAALIGLALDELGWDTREAQRIYSKEQQERALIKGKAKNLLQIGVAGLLILGGIALMMQARLEREKVKEDWFKAQNGRIMRLRRLETGTQQQLNQLREFEKWSGYCGRELEFLLTLQEGLTEDTVITDLLMEEGALKSLSGITPSVSILMNQLRKSPALRELRLKGNITVTDGGLELFQLEGSIKTKETVGE
jgi:Tfp pilus assembly PilM family ATPase